MTEDKDVVHLPPLQDGGTPLMDLKGGKKIGKKELQRIENVRVDGFGIRLVEKQFLNALLRTEGRLVEAYRQAFPDETTCAATMLMRAKKIVNRGRVQEYMKQILASKEISPEFVLGGIAKVAKSAARDSDKLHGYELLGKFLKMFKSEGVKNTTLNLNINEETARRLLERRDKHEIGGRGDFIDVKPGGDVGDVIDGEEVID